MDEWKKIEEPVDPNGQPPESVPPAATAVEEPPAVSHGVERWAEAVSYFETSGGEPRAEVTPAPPPRKPRKKRSDAGVPRKKKPKPPEESAAGGEGEPASHGQGLPEEELPAGPIVALEETGEVIHSSRYGRGGRRRGRHRYAAPLGLLVLLLAVVGVISLIVVGVNALRSQNDDTELRTQIMEFLDPVILYNPTAFSDVNNTQQDALLQAAVWRVTEKERIRQLRVKDESNTYEMDDLGRMIIPVKTIEESYAALFGPQAKPAHHTIGEPGTSIALEYDGDNGYYHVPISAIGGSSSSLYVPVLDTLKKKGDTLTARVGYVPAANIGIDEKGEEIPPTFNMATSIQNYTLKKNGSGWIITAIADEKK